MEKTTKNWLLVGLGLAAVAGAIMYFKPKNEEGAEETSSFWGVKKTRTKDTFRNTGVPCNAAAPGDVPKSGTIHVNGWGGKFCIPSTAS